jgi:peptidoglycan hydrolase-like protein with peptidoglycan-binding domain
MPLDISAPVGTSTSTMRAVNNAADVKIVQGLLNAVPIDMGGPNPKLAVDGLVGPKTMAAITTFQQQQLGFNDGLVEPGKNTVRRLNEVAAQQMQRCGSKEIAHVNPYSMPQS